MRGVAKVLCEAKQVNDLTLDLEQISNKKRELKEKLAAERGQLNRRLAETDESQRQVRRRITGKQSVDQ